MSEIFPENVFLRKTSDWTSAQMQEFNDVREFFKIQRAKYTKYKILYGAVQECERYLEGELRNKVRDILLAESCAQVLELESNRFSQNSQVLLGLTDLNSKQTDLNYNESLKIRKAVELVLQNKHKTICDQFCKIVGKDIYFEDTTDFGDFSLINEDEMLLKLRRNVEEQFKTYINNLVREQEILENLVKLKVDKLPEVYNEKLKECEIKSRVSELQSKIAQTKTRINIFMENNNSLLAYEELMRDLVEQQEECKRDIQYLKKRKGQYQQVACKKYDELLKSFIQLKSSLAKKKMIYESLNS